MESLKRCHLALSGIAIFMVSWQFTQAGDCPADARTWVHFGQSCYHFVHGEEDIAKSYTIEDANNMCLGYDLVKIGSAEENNFIIKYSPNVWKENIDVWLGMYFDSDDDDFKWNDGTVLSFKNWANSSSTSDLVPIDMCVALHSSTGQWNTVSCAEQHENGVVCEAIQQSEETGKSKSSPLLSALVILCVVAIVGISAVFWFLHQKNHPGSSILTSFEYHPPLRPPPAHKAGLVEAEYTDNVP